MEKEKKDEKIVKVGITGASSETIQRYGSAIKEHMVAYSGIDNENGKTLQKSLKQISTCKINPKYEYENIHQQAGFAAEVKEVANVNAERIISKKKVRKVRTDDLGRVNDQLFDHVMIDANGRMVDDSGSQMKFIGASAKDIAGKDAPKRALNKLRSTKFEKYLDNDAKIDVPLDYYDKMMELVGQEKKKLNEQLEYLISHGMVEKAEAIEGQIKKLEKIEKNLRKSTISSEEAVYARLHPVRSTAKSVTKVAHKAGFETAKIAVVVGGSAAIVRNLVEVIKGKEEPEEAIKCVAKETGTSAVYGYGIGFTGSAIKGMMQNASSKSIRELSNTNLPGVIVDVTFTVGKVMKQYFRGEINGIECLENLGREGTTSLATAMFATIGEMAIGQLAIPIPVVGGLIGGMIGYAVSSASYDILVESLRDAELAREERILVEKECREQIELIRKYREEMEVLINQYLRSKSETFYQAFANIKTSLNIGDIDGFIAGTNRIAEEFGKQSQFSTFEEFDGIMESSETIRL